MEASRSRTAGSVAAATAAVSLLALAGKDSVGTAFTVASPAVHGQVAHPEVSAVAEQVQPIAAPAPQSVASAFGAGALTVSAVFALSSARARNSTKSVRPSATLVQAFEGELGVQAPVGFWDPLGLSSSGDVDDFKRRREVELKHGRVSMLACIGYIVPEYFKWPGYLSPKLGLKFDDVPNGLAALTKVPGVGWGQIAAFLGVYELLLYKNVGDEPGNYGTGSLGLGILGPVKDPEARKKKLSAELANGRLAMMAIIGMFFQNGLTGTAWGDWALYTDSPLR